MNKSELRDRKLLHLSAFWRQGIAAHRANVQHAATHGLIFRYTAEDVMAAIEACAAHLDKVMREGE